jgi:hypothetical protein
MDNPSGAENLSTIELIKRRFRRVTGRVLIMTVEEEIVAAALPGSASVEQFVARMPKTLELCKKQVVWYLKSVGGGSDEGVDLGALASRVASDTEYLTSEQFQKDVAAMRVAAAPDAPAEHGAPAAGEPSAAPEAAARDPVKEAHELAGAYSGMAGRPMNALELIALFPGALSGSGGASSAEVEARLHWAESAYERGREVYMRFCDRAVSYEWFLEQHWKDLSAGTGGGVGDPLEWLEGTLVASIVNSPDYRDRLKRATEKVHKSLYGTSMPASEVGTVVSRARVGAVPCTSAELTELVTEAAERYLVIQDHVRSAYQAALTRQPEDDELGVAAGLFTRESVPTPARDAADAASLRGLARSLCSRPEFTVVLAAKVRERNPDLSTRGVFDAIAELTAKYEARPEEILDEI